MTRRKVEEPKTARTSMAFKQSELDTWRNFATKNDFKSFSDFVRQSINHYIDWSKNES